MSLGGARPAGAAARGMNGGPHCSHRSRDATVAGSVTWHAASQTGQWKRNRAIARHWSAEGGPGMGPLSSGQALNAKHLTSW